MKLNLKNILILGVVAYGGYWAWKKYGATYKNWMKK
jgi:hypothetical protein